MIFFFTNLLQNGRVDAQFLRVFFCAVYAIMRRICDSLAQVG